MDVSAPLRVLARPAFANRTNPYTGLVYRAMRAGGTRVAEWTLASAFLGRWDIVHVHWPETVFDHSIVEALPTTEALLASVGAARKRGARLVWTIHNLQAHGRRWPRLEERFRERWLAELDGVIALSESSLDAARAVMPGLREVPARVVPHPHFRGAYPDVRSRETARERLGLPPNARVVAFFGRIAPYKNVPALIGAFRELHDPEARLVIAGAPIDAQSGREVEEAARGDSRIHLHLRFVPEGDAQDFFRSADLVALPFRELLNSGSALLALSFDRPVLASQCGAIAGLATTLGPSWVHTFEGALSARTLEAALDASVDGRPDRTDGGHLQRLGPLEVAEATLGAYHAFMASRRAAPARGRPR